MATWGELNFGGLELGDERRETRLPKLVDQICRRPGGTLPEKLPEPKDLRSFYLMMKAKAVTHESVLARHYAATRAAVAEVAASGVAVLILHDATELDFTSKTTLRNDLGQIGQGTHRGYICHNSLAVRSDTKAALGLTSQILHHRADVPKNETLKQKRERENRESRLWVQGAERTALQAAEGLVVHVSDSLSDTFEYMSFMIRAGQLFVLRSRENRKLLAPVHGEQYLYEAIRSCPSQMEWDHEVPEGKDRAYRKTRLRISFTPVTLEVPGKATGEYPDEPLPMWAVRIWEPEAPPGVDPLEWILLTNVPVHNAADARVRGVWYECRFVVEEFHKGMKTGSGIERLQLTEIGRLEPAIGILSAVTTTLLQLRDAARAPDAETRPATEVVGEEYVEVIQQHYSHRLRGVVTVKQFYMHVARLGGHQNRKCDGFPGWLTLWRGWTRLESMTLGYRLARRKQRKTSGRT
jgi:hypothetical protein